MITWYAPYYREGHTFYPAVIRTSFGTFTVAWKISEGGFRTLVTFESASAKFSPSEIQLHLLRDASNGFTTIYREIMPLNNSFEPPLLKTMAVVKTTELESIFQ